MAISPTVVGTALPTLDITIERGRLVFFAESTGQQDPIYSDLDAARAAGHPDLPVPPTFLFGAKLVGPDPIGWVSDLGVDLRFVLHGSQRFEYHSLAFAGDELHFSAMISDLYEKKNGALEFLVLKTEVTRGDQPIASFVETVAIRHPELAAA